MVKCKDCSHCHVEYITTERYRRVRANLCDIDKEDMLIIDPETEKDCKEFEKVE